MVTRLRMRFQVKGCSNRHWFNLVIANNRKFRRDGKHIEQIGAYDPYPNERGEKLVLFDYDRIRYWLGIGAKPTPMVAHLLGLSGILPVYPPTLKLAEKRRKIIAENKRKEEEEEEKRILEEQKKLEEASKHEGGNDTIKSRELEEDVRTNNSVIS
ncbi:28S ribosomal protein S16, mitochondrial-like [Oopsacas minuta]|uniref:Small ribosomal subunit protein bS16m n=1 Tax=Oopsacas minuta TaxID=111878 RepID=A0AAV7K9W5_9METZ|nr:28S ribosomal protein S16, mitochondrial-like [Oopsacas minuta]